MPALDEGGEETATVFCSTPKIHAKHMLCLTPIRRQPDGNPTLGRAANKTRSLLRADCVPLHQVMGAALLPGYI